LNLQCTAAAPPLEDELRRGLPRGVEDVLFAMLEKKPEDRPSSAREVSDRLGLFRAAGGPAQAPRTGGGPVTRTSSTERTERQPVKVEASASPEARLDSSRPSSREREEAAKTEGSRTDTIALVEARSDRAREVPTWLAIVAIVALSLVAGMTTYLVRLKMTTDAPPATTAASADGRATTTSGSVKGVKPAGADDGPSRSGTSSTAR
jgi:serine/threonine-protein kinase